MNRFFGIENDCNHKIFEDDCHHEMTRGIQVYWGFSLGITKILSFFFLLFSFFERLQKNNQKNKVIERSIDLNHEKEK